MHWLIGLITCLLELLRSGWRTLHRRVQGRFRARRFRPQWGYVPGLQSTRRGSRWLTALLLLTLASTAWVGTGAQVANYVPSKTADISGLDLALARVAPARSLDQNGKIIGHHYPPTNYALSSGNAGAADSCTGRLSYTTKGAVSSIRVLYALFTVDSAGNENTVPPPSNVTYRASIEYPAGTFTRLFVNGSDTWTVVPNGKAFTDETGIFIPGATQFWVRTYVSCPTGGKFLGVRPLVSANGEAENALSHSLAGTDLTGSGTMTGGYGYAPGPTCIYGNDLQNVSIVGFGDSIMGGYGSFSPFTLNSYFDIAFANYNLVNTSIGGAKINQLLTNVNCSQRWSLLNSAPYVVTNIGTNDIYAGRTAAQVLADLTTLCNFCNQAGQRLTISTLLPRCDGTQAQATDGYITTAGQHIQINDAQRIAFNTSIRNGGTYVLPPFWKIFELADFCESARNSGFWAVPAAAAYNGTVSSATTSSLTVAGSPFTTNAYIQYAVRMDSGALAGLAKYVSTNTTNTISLSAAFGSAPAAGDTFSVWRVYTNDGVHPCGWVHTTLSGSTYLDPSKFVPFTTP